MTDSLQSSRQGPILTLTLNRPTRRNALTMELAHALAEALRTADRDPDVRVIVLAGAGGHFCSGIDMQAALEGADPSPAGRAALVQHTLVEGLHPAVLALWNCGKPTLGVLTGATVGFGLSLALACDLRLIADDGYVATQFAARGLFPDGGLMYQLERICGLGRALEWALRPDLKLPGPAAAAAGLAGASVPATQIAEAARALAEELRLGAPLAQRALKKAARGLELAQVLAEEVAPVVTCLTSDDAMEGLMAFFEKRATTFQGK